MFNVQSAEKHFYGTSKYINVADGVILTEALRYALDKVNQRQFLRRGISFQITDCREARVPFSTYQDVLVINGMTSYQTTSYFISNYLAKAPMVNVLSSSSSFDHRNSSGFTSKMEKVHFNVFRTVPSDVLETRALVDVLKQLNFTFVSVVSSNDLRTQEAVENFKTLAFKRGVCVEKTIWISINPNENEYEGVVVKLTRAKSPKVVILFATTNEAFGVINAAKTINDLTFVSGTGLRANVFEAKFNQEASKGLLLLQNPDTYDEGFKKYFMNLNFNNNKYSWFGEYWSMVFDCSLPKEYRLLNNIYYDRRPQCLGNETLPDDKVDLRYANVKPLLKALETIVCAVKLSENEFNCDPAQNDCKSRIMKGAVKYMGRKKCNMNDSVLFNDRGFYGNSFKVLNFNGTRYNEVGNWSFNESSQVSSLNLLQNEIAWKGGTPPISQCYKECEIGWIEDRGKDGGICCYKCIKCNDNQFTVNNTCKDCPKFEVPNGLRLGCVRLPTVHITSQRVHSSVLKTMASMGLFFNTLVIIIFMKYRDYKIVKATGRELSLFILSTLYLSFALPLVFLIKPSIVVCAMQRFILSLSMNACYTPLMLKTSRIYRIFKASKTLVLKPTMVSTKSQFLICLGLIAVQVLLDIVWVVSDRPTVHLETSNDNSEVALTCKNNPVNAVLNLLPCFLLMSACTFFGYKTRNFPSNFNEAFSISITMYISCFLWAIFVPLLFLFDYKRDDIFVNAFLTAYFMVILGLVTLVGIFVPTVYKVFTNKDAGIRKSQFFHSENTPSSASTVFGNRLATESLQVRRQTTPTVCSILVQKDVATDPINHDDCPMHSLPDKGFDIQSKNQKISSSFGQRDVGTDPIFIEDCSLKFFLNDHVSNQNHFHRKRLGSI